METNDITANLYAGGSKTPTLYDFHVRFLGQGNADWVTYRSHAAASTTEVARVAGRFENRTKIVLDGKDFESPPHTSGGTAAVEVQFPDLTTVGGEANVISAMNASWASTKSYANATRIREEGFWIKLDTATGAYSATSTHVGHDYPASGGFARLDGFGATKPSDSVATPLVSDQPVYLVAWFHTHPSMEWTTPGLERPVGYSTADQNFSTNPSILIPGFVFDYISTHTNAVGDQVISSGHPTSSPGVVSHVGGLNRRPTP